MQIECDKIAREVLSKQIDTEEVREAAKEERTAWQDQEDRIFSDNPKPRTNEDVEIEAPKARNEVSNDGYSI